VVPGEVVGELERVVGHRLHDFAGLVDREGTTAEAAEEMMTFWLRHRLQSVVILAGSTGSEHEGVVPRLNRLSVTTLVDAVPPGAVADGDLDLLEVIWANTARALARILLYNDTEAALRRSITSFWQYQVGGLTALLRHLAHRPQ
jgi:hypothetical protein